MSCGESKNIYINVTLTIMKNNLFLSMLYIEMAYTKKPATRKIYKKKSVRKTAKSNKSLVALIKKVSLKPVETKHTHNIVENINLNHNAPYMVGTLLNTTTSVLDNNTGAQNYACRVGDEVIARGISFKIWFANKLDRPNVMYKIIIFEYKSGTTLSNPAPYYSQGTANYMIRDLDTETYKIIKVVNFNLQTNAQRIITVGGALVGAEGHKAVSIYIPLRNRKIKYENNSTTPRFTDMGYSIVAYDSYGTAITDSIATFAINTKFYFKDP